VNELAINGGPKAKPTPFARPNRYGEEELAQLREVIESGRLMGPGGKIREFEEAIEKAFGVKHAIMVSSGTAAIHTALAALGVVEGDEVITTPMTDIGTVIPILAQHAVPAFADINLETRLICPKSVEERITKRTRAIIAIHSAGMPCDMNALLKIGEKTGVRILEDCSQAHGARYKGRFVGAIGDIAAFSMNESKQITSGDGGFVVTNDPVMARVAARFRDKAYDRSGLPRGAEPIPFLGMNYRPTCLQAAVALAHLRKLDWVVRRRSEIAKRYYRELSHLPYLEFPKLVDGAEPSWWPLPTRYAAETPARDELVAALAAEGIPVDTGMSPANNILRTELFRKKKYYPFSDKAPVFWRNAVYDPDSCPNVDELQRTVIRLPVDQRFTDEDITQTIAAFRKVWRHYFK